MKRIFPLIGLIFILSCSGGGSSTSSANNNTNSDITATLVLDSGAATTADLTVDVAVTGTSSNNLTAYLLSESSTQPSASDSGWVSVSVSTSLSRSSSFVLSGADGSKTVYLYVKDQSGNIATASATIILDTTKPTGTLLIDSGNKLTQSSTITFTLTGSDSTAGIVAYAYTTSSTPLTASSSSWTSISKTTSLSRTSDTATLATPLSGKKTYYGWLKDAAGNVSAAITDDIEVLKIFTTNSGNHFGQYSSIALDSDDAPYISTYQSTSTSLSYFIFDEATQALSHGTVEDIAGVNLGTYTSIAVDSNNHLHIAYRDETNSKLKYATNASGAWVKETIESGGLNAHISIDSNDTIYMTHTASSDIRYVHGVAGAWSSQSIFSLGAPFFIDSNVTIDSNNKIHIAGYSVNGLYYTKNISGTFSEELVNSDIAAGVRMALNSSNVPSIVYSSNQGPLKLVQKNGSSWIASTIDDATNTASSNIAIDSQEKIHIIYYDSTNKNLKYATNYSGSWQTTTLDSTGDVGNYCDIAIDSNDRIHISYYDATNQQLKYATTADVN